jgi:hypothetical protein
MTTNKNAITASAISKRDELRELLTEVKVGVGVSVEVEDDGTGVGLKGVAVIVTVCVGLHSLDSAGVNVMLLYPFPD